MDSNITNPLFAKLPPISTKLFEAKKQKALSFADIGKKMGRSEVWVAGIFYGQAKPDEEDIQKLSKVLGLPETYLHHDIGTDFFPDRGGLMSNPPSDPLIYRLHEAIQLWGYPIKAIVHEKFGDGIMSAVNFEVSVDKAAASDGDHVIIKFDGKFLPYKKF